MRKMEFALNKKILFEFAQMVLGNAICAFAVVCFALPYKMVVGGMSGIGRIFNYSMGVSVTYVVAALNIALFLIGALVLGKKFALTIALGTFSFPFFMGIFEHFESLQHMVSEPMLAAVCAGVLDGIGLGLVLRVGGSTGGIDVPAMILNRKLGWKLPAVMSAIDIGIFLAQIPITKPEGIILGILYTLIYSVVMDKMIVLEQGGYQIMIWTEKLSEVNEELLEIGFGTTLIKSRGGYLRDEKEVILCAASNRNFNKVKRAVLAIDDKAFMTITGVSEVNGNGFTYMLADGKYEPEIEDRCDGRRASCKTD
ncbi:MAG: YitT family protein [Mogibacterium sp.]|nr:YitT family protein [Mogibacterium sp.]